MATWSHVRSIVGELPETDEHASYRGAPSWRVRRTGFVWERPLGKKDLQDVRDLGIEPPNGPVLGVRVADDGVKQSLLQGDPEVFFTIPHFDGFPAVLVRLDRISLPVLREIIVEAWLDRAPARLAQEYQARCPGDGSAGLPSGLGAPATRALENAGLTTLADLDGVTESQLLAMHGVGPKAIRVLSEALAGVGLSLG